ncbi:hypothetical protein AMK19_30700 [Kitasatospora sp. CB01950]|nr:hypothetical protein AMK19_30700 [Kitasatospora sp. CB01950]
MREQVVFRLLALEERNALTPGHVRLAAVSAGRSVQRRLQAARQQGRTARKARPRFTATDEVHARLALWHGNAAAVHRELAAQARVPADGSAVGGARRGVGLGCRG